MRKQIRRNGVVNSGLARRDSPRALQDCHTVRRPYIQQQPPSQGKRLAEARAAGGSQVGEKDPMRLSYALFPGPPPKRTTHCFDLIEVLLSQLVFTLKLSAEARELQQRLLTVHRQPVRLELFSQISFRLGVWFGDRLEGSIDEAQRLFETNAGSHPTLCAESCES